MKKQWKIFAVLITMCPLCFGATLNSINRDQFKEAFVDKTFTAISTSELNGKEINNRVTVYVGNKGKIKGKFSDKPANSVQIDQGVYKIKDDGMICITWQHWFNAKEECVYAYNTQNSYIMVDNNNIFHFSIMKFAIKSGDNLKT